MVERNVLHALHSCCFESLLCASRVVSFLAGMERPAWSLALIIACRRALSAARSVYSGDATASVVLYIACSGVVGAWRLVWGEWHTWGN